ncbi:MAG: BrnT family toxin [Thermodesulfobacteriota bacterium]|nr:BrnT family toxin [Thermodesulfobacteriota bacterium]
MGRDLTQWSLDKLYISEIYRRCLFVVFTTRSNHIRVISARDMNKKEGRECELL